MKEKVFKRVWGRLLAVLVAVAMVIPFAYAGGEQGVCSKPSGKL